MKGLQFSSEGRVKSKVVRVQSTALSSRLDYNTRTSSAPFINLLDLNIYVMSLCCLHSSFIVVVDVCDYLIQ